MKEEVTLEEIDRLYTVIYEELMNNSDEDMSILASRLMYYILNFSITSRSLDWKVLQNELWKYFHVNEFELKKKVP